MKSIKILEIDNSPTHTEVILNKTAAYIVEIACRLGGDFITSHLVPLATGVNMLQNLLNLSLGKEVNIESNQKRVAAVQFLNQDNYKSCVATQASGNKAIVHYEIKPYHTGEIISSFDRMGYLILNTNSIEEMKKILQQLK